MTSEKQMKRSQELSGQCFEKILALLDRFGSSAAAMEQAESHMRPIRSLIFFLTVNNIHIYTMNKPHVAAAIMNNLLSEIIKA